MSSTSNATADPDVEVPVGAEVSWARANTVTDPGRRERLWRQLAEVWPDDDHLRETDRDVPFPSTFRARPCPGRVG